MLYELTLVSCKSLVVIITVLVLAIIGSITPSQSGSESHGNEGVLYIAQTLSISKFYHQSK